jgi:hypothetical protein
MIRTVAVASHQCKHFTSATTTTTTALACLLPVAETHACMPMVSGSSVSSSGCTRSLPQLGGALSL